MKHLKLFKTQTEFDKTNMFLSIPNVFLISDTNKYVIENNTLTVSDDLGIVTKIEFNGLKRKDNGQRDFIGQMTSYLDNNGNPFIIENKTVERDDAYRRKVTQFVTKEFSDYENDYSPDNKIKLFLWNNDHL